MRNADSESFDFSGIFKKFNMPIQVDVPICFNHFLLASFRDVSQHSALPAKGVEIVIAKTVSHDLGPDS